MLAMNMNVSCEPEFDMNVYLSVVFVCELVSMPTVGYKTQVSYKSNVVSNLCFPF